MSETANNLLSISKAKVLLALGEGPWEENIDGTQIFLNGTPLINGEGTANFPDVVWDYRPGTRDQAYIQGIPSVENDISINVELTNAAPWVRGVTDSMLSAVRVRLRWPAVFEQKSNGDIDGYRIDYAIDVSTDGGAFETVLTSAVDGKTNTTYERAHRVDLPTGSSWQVRVRRLTANRHLSTIGDTMFVSAITEIVDAKLSYPNTALLYVEYDAKTFDSVPTVAVDKRMRVIQVPSNYDVENRTYSGVWDGSFKFAWTNNPAWVFYDVVVNDRFGLGQRITPDLVDKWSLYEIAQYCDDLVPDGKGGTEPRHVCDVYIQQAKEAWQVLRDIAAIYRGMSYWAGGQMVTVADMPADSCYVFNNANVKDGRFSYSGTSVRSKYSRALVSYDNPENDYETDTTSVADNKLQMRYGDNVIELSAIGCARESEAQRRGKWAIYTNNNNRMVTFTSGLDGYIPLPGKVFAVADRLIAGKRIGGRISAINGNVITLDSESAAEVNDRLQLNLPSGRSEARTIIAVSGRDVEVSTEYSEQPEPEACWALDSDNLTVQYFKCLSIKRADSDSIEFDITGVETNPSKYAAIDNGAKLMERPISSLLSNLQKAPTEVTINQHAYVEQAQSVTVMTISWPVTENAVAYEVQWQKDSGNWVSAGQTGTNQIDIRGVYTGQYLARVRAINANGIQSVFTISVLTDITGANGELDTVQSLTTTSELFAIKLDWTFPASAGATQYTEIRYSVGSNGANPITLGIFAYPQNTYTMQGLAIGTAFYFSARLVDKFDNKSAWSAGVLGQASSDADLLLGYLNEQITESQFAQTLQSKIELATQSGSALADNLAAVRQSIEDAKAQLLLAQFDISTNQQDRVAFNARIALLDEARALIDSRLGELGDQVGTIGTRISNVETENAGTAERLSAVEASSEQSASRVASLEQASDEQALSIDDLETVNASQSSRLTNVEQTNASQAQSLTQLQTQQNNQGTSIANLQQTTADQALEMQQIEAEQGQHSSSINNLQQASSDQAQQFSELETEVNDQSSRVSQIETTTAAQAQSLTQLQTQQNNQSSSITQLQRTGVLSAERAAQLQVEKDNAAAEMLLQEFASAKEVRRTSLLSVRVGDSESNIVELQQVTESTAQTIEQLSSQTADTSAAVEDTAQTLADLEGDVLALRTIKVQTTSGGKTVMAGIVLGADGETSEIGLLAQRLFIANETNDGNVIYPFIIENGLPVMNQAMIATLLNKTLIQRVGGSLQVFGVGFGSSNQFVEWFGPDVGDISNCTEANGTSWKKIDGSAYFGGAITTGDFKNSVTSSQLSASAAVDTSFGSNGNIITIAVSLQCNGYFFRNEAGSPANGSTSGSVVLERSLNAGETWQVVQTIACGGTWTIDQENTDRIGTSYLYGSGTYTDSDQTTATRYYRARVTTYNAGSVQFTTQRLSLIATENT